MVICKTRRSFIKRSIYFFSGFYLSLVVVDFKLYNSKLKFVCKDFFSMGTYGKVQIFVDDINYGILIIQKVLKRIHEIECLLTKFSPNSDVGFINKNPGSYNLVSKDTLEVLKIGDKISYMTDGYFDMGMGNILSASGIDECVPIVDSITTLNNVHDNLFDIHGSSVKLNRKNVMLDLGGIGKGYALDEAIKIFLKFNINHVAIELGGDISVYGGMPFGSPWVIDINSSLSFFLKLNSSFLKIKTGSVAISGGFIKKNNDSQHHIVNPKSLKSRGLYFLSIVRGKQSAVCDSLSTACFNMDFDLLCKTRNLFYDYDIQVYV